MKEHEDDTAALSASEEPARLPVAEIHESDQTVVSEVTLAACSSLFLGPLYPCRSTLPPDVDHVVAADDHPVSTSLEKEPSVKDGGAISASSPVTSDPPVLCVGHHSKEKALGSSSKEGDDTSASSNPPESPRNEHKEFQQHTLNNVLPLPDLARQPQRSPNSQPGAHAVGGRAQFAQPPRLESTSQPPQEHDEHSSGLEGSVSNTTFDAFLVSSEELNTLQEDNADVECQDNGIQEVVDGISISAKNGHGYQRTKKWIFPLIALALIVLGCVVLVVVMVTQNKAEDNAKSTPAPSQNETEPIVYPPFRDDLNAETLKALKQGTDTPETRANVWMWNDPNLALYSKERQKRRFGLVALYYATQGDQWFQNEFWLDYDVSECKWFSKTTSDQPVCENDSDGMEILDLHSNNLNGTFPKNIWDIKSKYIDVSRNLLGGNVPPFPANSEFLEHIKFAWNDIEGRMLAESGFSAPNILTVAMNDNRIQGNNAAIYQRINKCQFLNFTVNEIQGGISPSLHYLTDLRYLGGGYNLLKGPMPSELGLLTKLEVLDYSGIPNLNGTIPTELNQLTSLLEFDIAGSGFTGTLPEAFCEQNDLQALHIDANCSSMVCCT